MLRIDGVPETTPTSSNSALSLGKVDQGAGSTSAWLVRQGAGSTSAWLSKFSQSGTDNKVQGSNIALFGIFPGSSASSLGKAEDKAHGSGDIGVMTLSVRQSLATALSGAEGDYQPFITDKNGRHYARSVPDRPSQGNSRSYVTAQLENQTGDANVYTVTSGKKLYMTSFVLTAFNLSTTNAGRFVIRDGSAGTILIPFDSSAAGVAAAVAAVPLQPGSLTFSEPLQFSARVYADILSGTITYAVMFNGYEEP